MSCRKLLNVKLSKQRYFSTTSVTLENYKCKLLVVGGGTGGSSVAAKFSSKYGKDKVIVLEPSSKHYYQPMFTMIGGGMKTLSQSYQDMSFVLPKDAKWIKEKAVRFNPKSNEVITENGDIIKYDLLLIAVGLELNYEKVTGLKEALSIPNGNVTSIYSPQYVNRHLAALKNYKKGNIVFTFPASPVKCPGAPQKICYITEDYLRKNNKLKESKIIYNTALPVIFGVKYYADALWKVANERNITVNLKTNLIEVRAEENIAIFQNVENPNEKTKIEYAILHAVPPQSTPKILAEHKELVNETGFVNVHKHTLQHVKYSNIFAIGDCSSSPNSKTMAAAASQSGVIFENMQSYLKGKDLKASYDGYASCPLVTGYSSCIMAEFDYDLKPLETFPIAQNKERYSMFLMKKDFFPQLYWQLMVKGLWSGPEQFRKIFSIFKTKQQY